MAGVVKALRRTLVRLLRPLTSGELVRPGKRLSANADRLLPDAVTGWLRDRFRPSEEEAEGERPHEADLAEVLVDAGGIPIHQAVLVAVPVEIAYNQFTQFEDFPDFTRAVATAEQIDAVQVELELRRWGLRRSWRAHIVDQRPEERIAWRSVRGMRLAGVTTFHSIADRLTRVEVSVVVESAGGVQRIARRMGLVDRAIAAELDRFKAFIEMREEETGGWRGYIADGEEVEEQDYFGWEPDAEGREDASSAASREAGKSEAPDQGSRSNGASAGKPEKSGAGRTRAGERTGGSRTRA